MATDEKVPNMKARQSENGNDSTGSEGSTSDQTDSCFTEKHFRPGVLPTSASHWTSRDLKSIGVSYSPDVSEIKHLLSIIQIGRELPVSKELPEIGQTLVELTKEVFNISFNCKSPRSNLETSQNLEKISNLISGFSSQIESFREQHSRLLLDSTNFRAFCKWSCNIREFFTDVQSFVIRRGQEEPTDGMFRHLFMMFSRICLLKPEPGEIHTGSLRMKGQEINAVPDVRFTQNLHGQPLQIQVVTMAEMKKHDVNEPGPPPSKLLSQHAAKLLIEMTSSYFMPAVLGIVCIGTKITFTFLEMDIDVFCKQLLHKTERGHKLHPVIQHTKAYDYMDVDDRTEILEFLFWLGYVQSMGYEDI
ncbi:hypothetical protein FSP39_009328 [Pinctada imbricata]|uniref:Uncharacterized protein n=1 Tax=Pinctada imbricata TaxID=66713 RepID=A0AA88YQS5_PINIB|nr:hypothetical protein FSP39_009328 [Pinctada imbricata]